MGLDHIAYDLQSLNYYREAMDKMCEVLKDTETPFENDDGENRFFGIEELVPLAEDYKKCKKKKKKVLVNADGVECEKCNKKVPIKYYLGNADDEMWVECIHTGWYCPNHSPTSNCDDDECPCCMSEEEKKWYNVEKSVITQFKKANFGGEQVAIKSWDDKGRECWNCARCGGWKDWKVSCCGKTKF